MAVIVRWGSKNSETMSGQTCKGDIALNCPSHPPLSQFQNGFPIGGCSLPMPIYKYKYMFNVYTKYLVISLGFYIYSTNVY